MQIPLQIVPARDSQREATAWLIPGADLQALLGHITQWNAPLDSLVLLPIPRSGSTSEPIGVLVISLQGNLNVETVSPVRGTALNNACLLPYGRIARRLFVPVDALFSPAVSDAELLKRLPDDRSDYVWHPSAGFVRFDPADRLTIADLLEAPNERSESWDRAVPGMIFRSRIMSLVPDNPPTAEQVIHQAASDIGSKRPMLNELPPAPDEWLGGKLNQMSKPIRNSIRSLREWLTNAFSTKDTPHKEDSPSKSPGTSVSPGGAALGWLGWGLAPFALVGGAAAAVAGRLMNRLGASALVDQLTRNREIDRLLNLLQSDPDEGLRFALPMGGPDQSRGIATPTNHLVNREIGFNLGRIAGGGPADVWDIPPEAQMKLVQQYRELAMREIRLGRHRRAAYIYAELMADLVSAAGALEAGLHFREAAVLYRERLKRPQDAARCLERGGLLDEAAEQYVEVGQFEKAAELYVKLDRHDEAERLLKSWVEQLVENGDLRNASRVLQDKLNDVDRAIAVLSLGWPRASIAQWCLQELFVVLGRHSRHDEARHRIVALRAAIADRKVTKMLALTMSNVFVDYPDVAIRELARDSTQSCVARLLPDSNQSESAELLANIRRLAPEDRLLSRDCDRFVRAREKALPPKGAIKITPRGVTALSSFSLWPENIGTKRADFKGTADLVRGLGNNIEWKIAKSSGHAAYAAGFANNSLVLQRISWANPDLRNMRAFWAGIIERQIFLEPSPGDTEDLMLHAQGVRSIQKRGLPTPSPDTRSMMLAGSPPWATETTLAMTRSANGCGWQLQGSVGTLAIRCYGPRGEPLIDQGLGFGSLGNINAEDIRLLVGSQRVLLGIGNVLVSIALDGQNIVDSSSYRFRELPSNIRYLIGLPRKSDEWLLTLLETGGMLSDGQELDSSIPIAEELESPCGTSLDDGRFVVAGGGGILAYQIVSNRPQLIGQADLEHIPISVTATNKLGEFAVFSANGNVQVFKLR